MADATRPPHKKEREFHFAGLVLAGGRSTRFGGEKAVALLRGKPLMLWCADALRGVCDTVAISARPGSAAETLAKSHGLDIVHDGAAHPAGPLAGVAAGLAWAATSDFDGIVTLPCDTPLVDARALTRLIAACAQHPAAYAAPPERPQGLCAAWRLDVLKPLDARLANGDHPAVHRWLEEIGAAGVVFTDGRPFRNINTREDLARLPSPL